MSTEDEARRTAWRIEGDISDDLVDEFCNHSRVTVNGVRYRLEECDDPAGPLVLVGDNDKAKRYEVEIEVHVRPLPPEDKKSAEQCRCVRWCEELDDACHLNGVPHAHPDGDGPCRVHPEIARAPLIPLRAGVA